MPKESIFNVSDNIMLDPSLFIDGEKQEKIRDFIYEHKELNFFFPSSFVRIFDALNSDEANKILKFYDISERDLVYFSDTSRNYIPLINSFSTSMEHFEKHAQFFNELDKSTENKLLRDILFEEWVFLQEYSWIVSKTQKTFDEFKECGAWVLEGGQKAFDFAAKRMLRKNKDDVLSRADKLRAIGKWIGVGLSSATVFITPMAAFGILAAYGYMMTIDPEE